MVFHWSLSDSKSPQVSRTLLSILNNAVVWMVSTRPPSSKPSSPFSNPLVTVPNAPITIGIIVTCMFHSFFQFPSKVKVLILLFTFFQFYSVVSRDSKVDYFASSLLFFFFFLLIIIKPGLLAGIKGTVCMLKSHRSLCVAFSRTGAGLFYAITKKYLLKCMFVYNFISSKYEVMLIASVVIFWCNMSVCKFYVLRHNVNYIFTRHRTMKS